MAPGRILQIFLRVTIQDQIRVAQWVSSSTHPVSMLNLQILSSYFMCDFCDTSLLIRFRTHSRREGAGACRGKAPPSCLRKTVRSLKSPTGAFIAPLCCANASLPMAGRTGLSHYQQRKTERSRRGTPCCTYRCCLWL